MKLLITINCFASSNTGTLVFVSAWKHFLDKLQPKFDILFVNNGFPEVLFNSTVEPYKTFKINVPINTPFDTEATFWPIHANMNNYDYVLRVDHDAFPNERSLDAIYNFIEANPDVDFMSASNYCRPIEHNRDALPNLDYRFVGEGRSNWLWRPWKYPTHNSDLFVIKTSFFERCLKRYSQTPAIIARKSPHHCPFATNKLRYGEICAILGEDFNLNKATANLAIHIDGSIDADFWTMMCAEKMVMAGIQDGGSSFSIKNHVMHFGHALQIGDFDKFVDQSDVSYPHSKNVNAPYFHLGNGYLAEWHFDSFNGHQRENFNYFGSSFKDNNFAFYAAHMALVELFTKASGNKELISKLAENQAKMFPVCGVDREKYDDFRRSICSAYIGGIAHVINEDNVDFRN